jgi:hypothetical protein
MTTGYNPAARQAAGLLAVAARPRRRVTDVPDGDISWFLDHERHVTAREARELARAEATGRRDGYVFRWRRAWGCAITAPGRETELAGTIEHLFLDPDPVSDPAARQVEQDLRREAGLPGQAAVGELTEVNEHGGIGANRSHYGHADRPAACPDGRHRARGDRPPARQLRRYAIPGI